MEKILILSAPLIERIWGSHYFKEQLQLTESNELIGEMWTVSGYFNNSSIILNGEYKGISLNDLYKMRQDLFDCKYDEFPILIKLISTTDDLSIQVHPADEYAYLYEKQMGKMEGWLILDSEKDSKLIIGHNAKDKEELIEYINSKNYHDLLIKHDVKKGDFFPIMPGTIHSIGKNLLILEIQQSSDLTYRFYDYDRIDKNGNRRELHINKALDVVTYNDKQNIQSINVNVSNKEKFWSNQYFDLKLLNIDNIIQYSKCGNFEIFTVIEGEVMIDNYLLKFGQSCILTSKCDNVKIKGKGKVVITEAK